MNDRPVPDCAVSAVSRHAASAQGPGAIPAPTPITVPVTAPMTTREWLRGAARPSRPLLRVLVLLGLAEAACATAAAGCLALALGAGFTGGKSPIWPLAGFAVLA